MDWTLISYQDYNMFLYYFTRRFTQLARQCPDYFYIFIFYSFLLIWSIFILTHLSEPRGTITESFFHPIKLVACKWIAFVLCIFLFVAYFWLFKCFLFWVAGHPYTLFTREHLRRNSLYRISRDYELFLLLRPQNFYRRFFSRFSGVTNLWQVEFLIIRDIFCIQNQTKKNC